MSILRHLLIYRQPLQALTSFHPHPLLLLQQIPHRFAIEDDPSGPRVFSRRRPCPFHQLYRFSSSLHLSLLQLFPHLFQQFIDQITVAHRKSAVSTGHMLARCPFPTAWTLNIERLLTARAIPLARLIDLLAARTEQRSLLRRFP